MIAVVQAHSPDFMAAVLFGIAQQSAVPRLVVVSYDHPQAIVPAWREFALLLADAGAALCCRSRPERRDALGRPHYGAFLGDAIAAAAAFTGSSEPLWYLNDDTVPVRPDCAEALLAALADARDALVIPRHEPTTSDRTDRRDQLGSGGPLWGACGHLDTWKRAAQRAAACFAPFEDSFARSAVRCVNADGAIVRHLRSQWQVGWGLDVDGVTALMDQLRNEMQR